MPDTKEIRPGVQESLQRVTELLRRHRQNLLPPDERPRPQQVEELLHKQDLATLQQRLDRLHPADVAYILEALPLEDRLVAWDLVRAERDGEILLEVSDAVRETLIAHMENTELVAATEQLDTDVMPL